MKLLQIFEQNLQNAHPSKTIAFLPGRFQPFHKRHKQVYDQLVQQRGVANVYVLTSDDQSSFKSPFNFSDKRQIMTRLCGIPGDKVLEVKSPYSIPPQLIQSIDEMNTVALFTVSSKDMTDNARFNFPSDGLAIRQDGQPKYLQKYPGSTDRCEPMASHAYVMEVDVYRFDVAGQTSTSASEIRELLVNDEDIAKNAFEDLYDVFDQDMFDMMRSRIESKVMTIEATHRGEQYNPQHLEAFRQQSVRELMRHREQIESLAKQCLNVRVVGFEPTGSVVDRSRFNPASNLCGQIVVSDSKQPNGVLEDETAIMQRAMIAHPFSFGVLTVQVINQITTESFVVEGGNVWKDSLRTQRIQQADVIPTVKWLETITGLDLASNMLGSTGRKDTSGDLDLGIAEDITPEMLKDKLQEWADAHDDSAFIKRSGPNVHFRTPIRGNGSNGYVQTDFMFLPDLEYSRWAMAAPESKYSAAAKAILLSSIAKHLGLKYSNVTGLVSRQTAQLIDGGKDGDVQARALLGPKASKKDLSTFETVIAALAKDPERDAKLVDAREILAKKGITI